MPPKPKFTNEEIINAAYALLERKGMDAVVAREVARELCSTPAPIFTCFENMEELKAAVHAKAISECTEYLRDCTDYFPAFKEFGLRWVRLAKEHPHVYNEVFIRKTSGDGLFADDLWQMLAPVRAEIVKTFGLSESEAAGLLRDMLLYVHGIAAIQIGGKPQMTEEDLRMNLSRMCLSYVSGYRIQKGLPVDAQLPAMFRHLDLIPRKKSEMGGIPHGDQT